MRALLFSDLAPVLMSLEPQGQKLPSAMLPLHLSAHCSFNVRPGKAQLGSSAGLKSNLCQTFYLSLYCSCWMFLNFSQNNRAPDNGNHAVLADHSIAYRPAQALSSPQ